MEPNNRFSIQAQLCRVRSADVDDVPAIYALKVQAFGDSFLLYTIYQAPQSIRYMTKLMSEASRQFGQEIYVLEQDGQISGYYHAVRRAEQYFLNYIAVAAKTKGSGLGGLLLGHFEETGKAHGCQTLGLDVFDSNSYVRDWYYRHGYHLITATFHVRLAMDLLADEGPSLVCEDAVWTNACAEEQIWGFSKVEGACRSGTLTVGLIAGRVCKLLNYSGLSVGDAALAIANRFKNERQVLIVSGLPDLPESWPILSAEKALRLVKDIK